MDSAVASRPANPTKSSQPNPPSQTWISLQEGGLTDIGILRYVSLEVEFDPRSLDIDLLKPTSTLPLILPPLHGPTSIALTAGFAYGVLNWLFHNISGGHMNPAVTLATLLNGRVTILRALCYWGIRVMAYRP